MCLIFIILIISRYAENVMPGIFSNSALTVNPCCSFYKRSCSTHAGWTYMVPKCYTTGWNFFLGRYRPRFSTSTFPSRAVSVPRR